jgi:O-antigen/teichoic acid export membrane protein
MENLKEKTAKGIAWGAVNNGATQVLSLIFGIVLARKLSTEDYGLVALLTIFTALAGCIQAAGFSQALANLKTPTHRDYNAVAWFNILAGCSMYVILFLCAPLIAWFFDQPLLTDVSRLVFLAIPVSAIGIVPNAKLWIELRTRENAVASITSLLFSGGCGVWMA